MTLDSGQSGDSKQNGFAIYAEIHEGLIWWAPPDWDSDDIVPQIFRIEGCWAT